MSLGAFTVESPDNPSIGNTAVARGTDLNTSRDAMDAQTIHVSARRIGALFGACAVLLAITGTLVQLGYFLGGHDEQMGLRSMLQLNSDATIPTWYASVSLLACSLLLAAHALVSRSLRHTDAIHWTCLSLVFLLLSIDEVGRIHEVVGGQIGAAAKRQVGTSVGLLYYSWIIAGAAFVALLAGLYARFLYRLHPQARWGMVAAGAVYLGGALGVEMLNGYTHWAIGTANLRYHLGTVLEEFLEMAGVAVFAYVLARHLQYRVGELRVRISLPSQRR